VAISGETLGDEVKSRLVKILEDGDRHCLSDVG
jgi:hypothetical protein